MKLQCPKCKRVLVISEDLIQKAAERGKNKGRCPHCRAFFIIPLPAKTIEDDAPIPVEHRPAAPPRPAQRVSVDDEPSSFITAGLDEDNLGNINDIDLSEIAAMEDEVSVPDEEPITGGGPGAEEPIGGGLGAGGGWHTVSDAPFKTDPVVDTRTGEHIESTLNMGGDAYAVEGKEAAELPVRKKLVVSAVTLLCLGIVAVIIFMLIGVNIKNKRVADTAAFQEAMRQNSLSLTRAYVQNYPDGLHIDEAKAALADHEAFEQALRGGVADGFDRYVKLHPSGRHVEEAAYQGAAVRDTVEALTAYLAAYPGGTHAATARGRIQQIEAAQAAMQARGKALGPALAAEADGRSPAEVLAAYQTCLRSGIPETYAREASARIVALAGAVGSSWQPNLRVQFLKKLEAGDVTPAMKAVLACACKCKAAEPLPADLQKPLGDTFLVTVAPEGIDVRPLALRYGRAPVCEAVAIGMGITRWASKLEVSIERVPLAQKAYSVPQPNGDPVDVTVSRNSVRVMVVVSRGGRPYIVKRASADDPDLPAAISYTPRAGETEPDPKRIVGYRHTADDEAMLKLADILQNGDFEKLAGPHAPLPRADRMSSERQAFLETCARAVFATESVSPREFARHFPQSPLLPEMMRLNITAAIPGP